ncbi:MAG: hypothetical protein AB9836_05420 [Aminipila sp.]
MDNNNLTNKKTKHKNSQNSPHVNKGRRAKEEEIKDQNNAQE